jgi:hypothetical protein
MKRLIALIVLLCGTLSFAQVTVEVKGVGQNRTTAIQDALRQAVAQVLGTKIVSETQVQNYQLLKDAIQTRTEGYIMSSEVIEETPFPDRHEVKVRATVSLKPLETDAKSLAQWLGGLRFMVVYDPRKIRTSQDKELYDYAYERMNEYLARKGYRYIEKAVFDRLKEEAVKIAGADISSIDYAKKLAFLADAEFFILISNILIEERPLNIMKATIDCKSYDNCVAEGLGTVVGEGDLKREVSEIGTKRKAIDGAAFNAMEKVMYLALKYLSGWCTNAAPFEIRIYQVDEDKMDELVDKLLDDPDYGGQLEPVISQGYWRLVCTFKKTPWKMRRKIRQYAEEIGVPLSTKLGYGRQFSFAPKEFKVREAEVREEIQKKIK